MEDVLAKVVPLHPKSVRQAHRWAMDRGAQCERCPLMGQERGPVPSEIRPGSLMIEIGETPAQQEIENRAPFVGPSGKTLNEGLNAGGVAREWTSVSNVLSCWHHETLSLDNYLKRLRREHERKIDAIDEEWERNCEAAVALGVPKPKRPEHPPFLSPIDYCRPRLERDLRESGAGTVLAVGGRALIELADIFGFKYGPHTDRDKVADDDVVIENIMAQAGLPVTLPARLAPHKILIAALHPAFAFHEEGNKRFLTSIKIHIAKAARIAKRGHYADWTSVEPLIFPTVEQVEQYCWALGNAGCLLSTDIETDSLDTFTAEIRCIGMLGRIQGQIAAIVVPWTHMDGSPWWSATDAVRVQAAVRYALDRCLLLGQNFSAYDLGILFRLGFVTDRWKLCCDLLLAFKSSRWGELPRGLAAIASLFLEVYPWKGEADKASIARSDRKLHVYNGVDLDTADRCWPIVAANVQAVGNARAFEIDTTVAPVAREAGDLGFVVHEGRRGEMSKHFNEISRTLWQRLQAMAGRVDRMGTTKRGKRKLIAGFNPRSVPQLKEILYSDLRTPDGSQINPPLNTDNAVWSEGEEGSTGLPALMALYYGEIELGPVIKAFLDALIEFRSVEATRRVFDKVQVRYDSDLDRLAAYYNGGVVPYADEVRLADDITGEDIIVLPRRPLFSRVRCEYRLGIPTGRWSSTPNVQNSSARLWGGVNARAMYVAPPGHKIVIADAKGLEVRAFALEANDEVMLDALRRDVDPHTLNVARTMCPMGSSWATIYGKYNEIVKWKKGTEDQQAELKYLRTAQKRGYFGFNYTQVKDTFFLRFSQERDKSNGKPTFPGITKDVTDYWWDAYDQSSPQTKHWHRQVSNQIRKYNWISDSRHGRKRFTDDLKEATSHVVSTRGRTYILDAIMRLHAVAPRGRFSEWSGFFYDGHDALGFYMPEGGATWMEQQLLEAMTFRDDPRCAIIPDPEHVVVDDLAQAA